VKVGVLGGANASARGGGTPSNVELAAIHEFGSDDGRIPARSFLRSTYDVNRIEYMTLLRKLTAGIYAGKMPIARALGIMGLKMEADIKRRVMTGAGIMTADGKGLRQSTIDRKGSSRPLIDTGRLIGSVSHVVVISKDSPNAPAAHLSLGTGALNVARRASGI